MNEQQTPTPQHLRAQLEDLEHRRAQGALPPFEYQALRRALLAKLARAGHDRFVEQHSPQPVNDKNSQDPLQEPLAEDPSAS